MSLFALGICVNTSAQDNKNPTQNDQRVRYYYYPSSNVYYNVTTGDYWYYDNGSTTWLQAKTLPTTIVVEKTPRYTVYYNGPEVWKDNAMHQKKYKAKKGGEKGEKIKDGQ